MKFSSLKFLWNVLSLVLFLSVQIQAAQQPEDRIASNVPTFLTSSSSDDDDYLTCDTNSDPPVFCRNRRLTCCNGSCKDLENDQFHCGRCFNSCGENAFCTRGFCFEM